VSDAELHKVREYTKGRMLLNLEDTRAVSAWYGSQTLLQDRARSVEEVVEKLEAVTQDDLTRVAADLLLEERLLLAVVGPFESAEPFEALLRF
jgi:predicted Zn-dependent peptidase